MRKLMWVVVIAIAVGAWQHLSKEGDKPGGRLVQAHDRVIMYSLTTCGYCRQKARELNEAGIRYEEYFIDEDETRHEELNRKLAEAGFSPRGYGTPILDVHGVMLPNNPSLETIRQNM